MNFFPLIISIILTVLTVCNGQNLNNLMNQTESLPSYERVLSFFKEINTVPRPSQHEEKMVVYLANFAKSRGLNYIIDGKNVIIYKGATVGMEQVPTLILQAHMDMVCVADDGYEIDFLNQGVETVNDGTFIRSKDKKTSIGADDGIGLSIILAILDSDDIKHGPLECLITWDEEQEFSGAIALTPGILKGHYMMNIDWETDGELCIGTAGGVDISATLAYNMTATPMGYTAYQLSITDATGGHSGISIVNGGANANKLLVDFLITQINGLRLASINGGSFPNVITISSSATVLVPEAQKDEFESQWEAFVTDVKQHYATTDPAMQCTLAPTVTPSESVTEEHTKAILSGLSNAPQGVTEWSTTIEEMFETSNNVGPITMNDGIFNVEYLVRGFNNKNIDDLANFIVSGFEESNIGFLCRKYGSFSPWNPDINSELMNYARNIYQEYFGKPITLRKVGGGLELSEFAVAYPDMQFISYGPTVNDPHTINENVEIRTVDNCWRYTLQLLRNFGNN